MERNDTDCKMEIRDYEVSKVTYMTWVKLECLYQANFIKPVGGIEGFREKGGEEGLRTESKRTTK